MSTTRRKSPARSRAKGRKSPKGGPRKPRFLPAKAHPEYTFETDAPATPAAPAPTPAAGEQPEPRPRVQKTISYPANWWQAIRERWAPTWWLARHPVEWKNVVYWEDVPPSTDPWTVAEDIQAGTLVSINGNVVGRAVGTGTSEFTSGGAKLRITRGPSSPLNETIDRLVEGMRVISSATEPGVYSTATVKITPTR